MDRLHQVCLTERLGQEIDRACLDRAHGRGNVAMSRDEDDLWLISLSRLPLKLKSVYVGKFHIQNQASRHVGLRICDVLSSGTKCDHV